MDAFKYILASRSPRRRELLGLVVPAGRIVVLPPRDSAEPGFEGLHDRQAIERRLLEIARSKAQDAARQLTSGPAESEAGLLKKGVLQKGGQAPRDAATPSGISGCGSEPVPLFSTDRVGARWAIIAADTNIVAADGAGRLQVLGQPPDDETWREVVGRWFRDYYAGRTHQALTALCVRTSAGRSAERVVSTEVAFIADVDRRLDWYLASGEPRGKAGGYGIQGLASLFVERIRGSLSNVVGLPLEALLEIFEELQIDFRD